MCGVGVCGQPSNIKYLIFMTVTYLNVEWNERRKCVLVRTKKQQKTLPPPPPLKKNPERVLNTQEYIIRGTGGWMGHQRQPSFTVKGQTYEKKF